MMGLKNAFEQYVAQHVADADRTQTLLHTAEDLLPDFIRRNIDENFTSLYAVKDKSLLKDYIERIILDPILKSEDASVNDEGYISTLTLYRRFMKSPIYGQLKDGVVEDMAAEPSADEQPTARTLSREPSCKTSIVRAGSATGRHVNNALPITERCTRAMWCASAVVSTLRKLTVRWDVASSRFTIAFRCRRLMVSTR